VGGFEQSGRLDVAITDKSTGAVSILLQAILSPTSLKFATQVVGTASSAQSVTLVNYGTAALTGITVKGADAGDFAQTNTCGSSVPPGASCTISVTFTPAEEGRAAASLAVGDNSPGSPKVSLSGTGTVVELAPSSLSFICGGLYPACPPPPKSITLTNVGSGTLDITSIAITGSSTFSQTNTCGSSVGAGGSCIITVTFTPTGSGTVTGDVSISDDGGGSPQQVSLSGTKDHICILHCK